MKNELKKNIRRAVTGLMSAMLAFMLVPTSVFAEDTETQPYGASADKTLSMGAETLTTAGYTGGWNTDNGVYVYFGKYDGEATQYRLLKLDGTKAFLDADKILWVDHVIDDDYVASQIWEGTYIQTKLNGDYFYNNADVFTSKERELIQLTHHEAADEYWISNNSINVRDGEASDKVFLLSCSEIDTLYSDNAQKVKHGVEFKTSSSSFPVYWTRSQGVNMDDFKAVVCWDGDYDYLPANWCSWQHHDVEEPPVEPFVGISPALTIDLSNVVFTTTAGYSHTEALFDNPVTDSDSRHYVMAVKDGNESFDAVINDGEVVSAQAGGTVNIGLSNVTASANQISAILLDADGNMMYYGKLAGTGDDAIDVEVPGGLALGDYTLRVFAEEAGEPDTTTYVSNMVDLTLKVRNILSDVKLSDVEYEYDGESHTIEADIQSSAGKVDVTFSTDGVTYSEICPEFKDVVLNEDGTVGSYTVYYKVTAVDYEDYFGKVKLTINPRPVTLTVKDCVKHIGLIGDGFEYSVEGLVGDDSLNVIIFEGFDVDKAGTYTVKASVPAASNPNYKITFVDGALTVEDHDWSGEWVVVKEATADENGKREKVCKGCTKKKEEIIPATGNGGNTENPDEGQLEKDVEIDEKAPIKEAALNNSKEELLEADGIFSDEEKKQIQSGSVDAKVWMEIKSVDESSISAADRSMIMNAAEAFVGSNPEVVLFNAELFKKVGQSDTEQIHRPGTSMNVTIKIPEELINHDASMLREYKIIRLHVDEVTGESSVDVLSGIFDEKNSTFTFTTDRFSTYAIAYKDTPVKNNDEPESKPDDKNPNESQPDDGEKPSGNNENESDGDGSYIVSPGTGRESSTVIVFAGIAAFIVVIIAMGASVKSKFFEHID